MKRVPKVEFQIASKEYYAPIILSFLSRGGDFADRIYNLYPELKKVTEKKNPEQAVLDYFEKWEEKNYSKLENAKKRFQCSWDKHNDKLVNAIAKVHETEWPEGLETIAVNITPNPICPRDLETNSFDLYHDFNEEEMKKVALHEISHFAYFKKLKEIHPEIPKKEYNSPGLAWQLSEIVPAVILEDKEIQKYFSHKPKYYHGIDSISINNKPVVEYLREMYSKKKDFSSFITESYNFAKKNQKNLKEILKK